MQIECFHCFLAETGVDSFVIRLMFGLQARLDGHEFIDIVSQVGDLPFQRRLLLFGVLLILAKGILQLLDVEILLIVEPL